MSTSIKEVCYYEVLNLQKTASSSDIKQAYKKLALVLFLIDSLEISS